MKLIQIILLIGLLAILVSYFRWFRTAAFDKLLIVLILLTGIVFVISPELTNTIAHKLGVGRGADLLFYLAIVGFGYALLLLYSKMRAIEKKLTEIIRTQSLNEAQKTK
jgi:small membrane protein